MFDRLPCKLLSWRLPAPGVYPARQGAAGDLVYVGMAGERRGQGLRGRLTVYRRGKAAVSGPGVAVPDRALADPKPVQHHLEELFGGVAKRAAVWARMRSWRLIFTSGGQ